MYHKQSEALQVKLGEKVEEISKLVGQNLKLEEDLRKSILRRNELAIQLHQMTTMNVGLSLENTKLIDENIMYSSRTEMNKQMPSESRSIVIDNAENINLPPFALSEDSSDEDHYIEDLVAKESDGLKVFFFVFFLLFINLF